MSRWAAVVAAGMLVAALGVPDPASAQRQASSNAGHRGQERAEAQGPYMAGELLVRFDPTTAEAERARIRRKHRLVKVADVALPGLERVRIRGGTPPARANDVARERAVRYAEPNFLWFPDSTPNDPDFSELWGLHNTGQTYMRGEVGTDDKDIDAPEGWDLAADTSNVVVAVIDTGTWTDHPDLAANMWTNPGEIAGNNTDDDGNGFVDDVHGFDFYWDDGSVFDRADGDDHGTHVAGTIAAVENNSTAVAGVSQAKIMALKFLGPNGGGTADAIDALDYAMTMGADVTNNSWGGGAYSEALAEKIEELGRAGILFVNSSGNSGLDLEATAVYPSSYASDYLVSVAATDDDDALASFSNYGSQTVDVGAPGVSILSSLPLVKTVRASHGSGGTAFHTFGLEGVVDTADRQALLAAALSNMGIATSDSMLLVDDPNGTGTFASSYEAALDAAGYTTRTTHSVSGCANGPDATTLNSYSAVVWFVARDYTCTLTTTDQTNLTSYINGGGDLLLFGGLIGYHLTDGGQIANDFFDGVLEAGYIQFEDNDLAIEGVSGTPYAGISVDLTAGYSAPGQYYSGGVHPRSGGTAWMSAPAPTAWYNGTSMAAPHVTGVIAHLIAKFPRMRALDIKERIMDLGDPATALATKTVSGNRLNLKNVLETGVISGTVSADGGGSLAGICVTAYSEPAGTYAATATTDALGDYTLTLPTDDYTIQFRDCTAPVEYGAEWHSGATDWQTATLVTVAPSTPQTVNAALAPGGSITGTVQAASTSLPLSGICVGAFTTAGTWIADGVTDALGSYTLSGFATGGYQVRFRDCTRTGTSQYATHWYNGSADHASFTTVSVNAGETTGSVNASLPLSGAVSGTVRSFDTNAVLNDICVSAYTEDGVFLGRVRTDAGGAYTVRGMGTTVVKIRYHDCSGLGFTTEWYQDKTSRTDANGISVTAGGTVNGIDAYLS